MLSCGYWNRLFLILMVSPLLIRYANANGVYALGSWEAPPAFKSWDPSQLLASQPVTCGRRPLGFPPFLGGALGPSKVKSHGVRPLLSSLTPGGPLWLPVLGISLVLTD